MLKPEFRSQKEIIEEIIRVNHAGEYGAVNIYYGQIKRIKDKKIMNLMSIMHDQEKIHLNYFENQIKERLLRPTIMLPIWKIIGNSLGYVTGIFGNNLALLVTESVETSISKHYLEQLEYLKTINEEKDLETHIAKFREEEMEHHDIAVDNGSKNSFCYGFVNKLIQNACQVSISISKKI